MNEVLSQWCQTVFGEAAAPMQDYYLAMDRAWTAMPIHATILGNALSAAPHLMTDGLQSEAVAALRTAEERLAKTEDSAARDRAATALQHERALFHQWLDLYRMNVDVPRVSLPLLVRASDFAQSASRSLVFPAAATDTPERQGRNQMRAAARTAVARSRWSLESEQEAELLTVSSPDFSTRVRLAWTEEALLVKWLCRDGQIDDCKATAGRRDDNVVADDSVEIVLSSGPTGETWHFAVNSKGTQQDYREGSTGVREDRWSPQWQATAGITADAWEVEMTIPFVSLGQVPNPNETWQARFVRHNGGRQDFATAVFTQRETSVLLFSSAARTGRSLLWWSGAPDRESRRNVALLQEFTEIGWQFHLVDDAERLDAFDDHCDVYWFRHPHGPSKPSADYWRKHLAPAVRDGALAVFVSYWGIPLDEYFQDSSWKVKVVACSKIPLAGRTTAFIAPGDWSRKPNDLFRRLKSQITPAYGFVPAEPEAWTVLVTASNGSETPYPYLLARRYGKGMVVLGGDDIRLSPARMLENFVRYHEQTKCPENQP
jgi:hypothetical protein